MTSAYAVLSKKPALAALNHPNIVAVYDIGSHEGKPYLVAEFLSGETLRERLDRGAIPVRKAISFAEGIAGALSAAHSKGITHRDLKPENIFLTSAGTVKVPTLVWHAARARRHRRAMTAQL